MAKTDFKSVDEYIASQPEAVQGVLERVRSTIRKAVPEAEEVISYKIPTYKLNAWPRALFRRLEAALFALPARPPRSSRHSRTRSHHTWSVRARSASRSPQPVPVKLIERIAKFRAKEVAEREKANLATPKKR